ncbi:MAG: hypothetical protein IKI48_04160 [Prevotella sp.]|nr:hypothetical protein [Prevotella sp.]
MITEVKNLDVTERILKKSVEGVNGELERRQVVDGVFRFVNYLEAVQRMPLVARLSLYQACYGVYDLLRRNGQLGRRVGMFDAEVKKAISGLLSKVLGDYGTGED